MWSKIQQKRVVNTQGWFIQWTYKFSKPTEKVTLVHVKYCLYNKKKGTNKQKNSNLELPVCSLHCPTSMTERLESNESTLGQ